MRKLVLSILGASSLALASAANAVVIIPGAPFVGDQSQGPTSFLVSPSNAADPSYVGQISATIGHTGIAAGSFTDTFQFTIPQSGTGGGSITTTIDALSALNTSTDLDITSVFINGVAAIETLRDINGVICFTEGVGSCGATETFARSLVPIVANVQNTIVVTGISRGLGSYGGNLVFSPTAVPEPATWAMMLLGFAGIGWQLRRKRSGTALAQLA